MNKDDLLTFIERNYRMIVILFFASLLVVGVCIYRDYGISWDELVSRNNGLLTYKYVFQGDPELLTYWDRYYGTSFELVLLLIEKAIGFDDPRGIFFMRHFATFLLFYLGAILFYFLCRKRFSSWKMALLGTLFLVLSPRIFAHAFYNSKDLAFMSLFIICMFTLMRYLEKKNLLNGVLHALTCAFLIGTRVLGIIAPLITALFVIVDLVTCRGAERGKELISFMVYLVLLGFCTVLFWPILWVAPIGQFMAAIKQMSHFQRFWSTVLYFGDYVKATELPWHYIPAWILITTPVVYSVCFFIGLGALVKDLFVNAGQFYRTRKQDLVALVWFFAPLASVVVLRSVLYDAWRHMFFIYPAFLLISMAGLSSFFNYLRKHFHGLAYSALYGVGVLVILANLATTSFFMIKYHPHQNVYFNIFTGSMQNAKEKFDMDYWGLSYRQALEYIVTNDKRDPIKVCASTPPGHVNFLSLVPDDRNRLVFVKDPKEADYFLSDYRWHKEDYPFKDEVYSIKVNGAKIMVVYKLQQGQ
ncbi:MAG: hypothetical protein PVH45_01510 [Candidatus Omnitrophota bacterium]|jgi:hypothetical protein